MRQYIRAGHVDEIHLAVAPVVLGQGEALFEGIDLRSLGYRTMEHVATERATHVVLTRWTTAVAPGGDAGGTGRCPWSPAVGA